MNKNDKNSSTKGSRLDFNWGTLKPSTRLLHLELYPDYPESRYKIRLDLNKRNSESRYRMMKAVDDDEGMIAEVMKQFSPELWTILITESFNDSFAEGMLSPLERFGILKILYKKGGD
jgi:hypothetical protein